MMPFFVEILELATAGLMFAAAMPFLKNVSFKKAVLYRGQAPVKSVKEVGEKLLAHEKGAK